LQDLQIYKSSSTTESSAMKKPVAPLANGSTPAPPLQTAQLAGISKFYGGNFNFMSGTMDYPEATQGSSDGPDSDKVNASETYILELEEKVKSLQNALNVLHLERSAAQEKASMLEDHCKRITSKWEADRNRLVELERSGPGTGRGEGALATDDKGGSFRNTSGESSWEAMRMHEMESLRAESNRLKEENSLLKRRIVSLQADVDTQSILVKQRTKSVVPELKVLRRRIEELEAENEDLHKADRAETRKALAKMDNPYPGVDVAAMMKEHEELRFATNQLLLQHDKVCQELVQLRESGNPAFGFSPIDIVVTDGDAGHGEEEEEEDA
jgi:hypothetical protein